MKTSLSFLIAGLLSAVCLPVSAQTNFTNVPIGGGGYVTGLVVHPLSGSLVYARTDVGGAYRYNPAANSWTQLLGQFVGKTYYSCDGMAVDPSDSSLQKAYVFTGDGTQAYLMYSANQGGSWTDTLFPSSVTGHGNDDYRWAGDRVAIDPNFAGRILVGTRQNGLWYNNTVNGTPNSANWHQYTAIPVGTGTGKSSQPIGVTFVAYASGSGTNGSGYTNTVYVGVSGQGVYVTTNGGTSWSAMTGSPSYPVQGRVDSSGNLYVTGGNTNAGSSYGGVWKYVSGAWTNITPTASSGAQFSAFSINPSNPSDLLVAVGVASPCPIYYSTAGSATTSSSWVAKTGTQNNTVPWQPAGFFEAHISYALFAPTATNPNQVWFGDWYDAWSTPNITVSSPTWTNSEQGFEETYILGCRPTSPTGSSTTQLFIGNEDVDGMADTNISAFPASQYSSSSDVHDTTSIDVSESNNQYVYRVGDTSQTSGKALGSTNGGSSWTVLGSLPSGTNPQAGRIAVAATNPSLVVWLPWEESGGSSVAATAYYSTNGGTSWTASNLPSQNWINNAYYAAQELASNKVTTNCFYVYDPSWGFYVSNTGSTAGSSFTLKSSNGLPSAASVSGFSLFGVKSVPGQDGGVWVNIAGSGSAFGIYKSTNYGTLFTQVSGIVSATAIAFGAPLSGSGQPAAVYCLGQKSGDTNDWVYESDDMGATWNKLNTSASLFGDKAVILEADRNVYEQVYVGTFGTGLFSNVLFSDAFSSGAAPNWTVDSGTWSVVSASGSEQYRVSSTAGGMAHAGSAGWTDYSVSAAITPLTLAHGTTMNLALRYASASNNYEALLYPGAVDIVKNVGGVQTVLATKSFTTSVNTQYEVEFVAVGSSLQVYVNGTLELSTTDTTFTSGAAAVGAYNATGEFDNVVVNPQ